MGLNHPLWMDRRFSYIDALRDAGIEEQNATRNYFEVSEYVHYRNPEKDIELAALPLDDYRLTVMVDYNSRVISSQHAYLNDISQFPEQIANCRTFVFLHELEALYRQNLIKGGDLTNAIVIVDREVRDGELDYLADLLHKPKVSVNKQEGILNNLELHYPNEMARHKLLDMVGDLALIGRPIKAQILAARAWSCRQRGVCQKNQETDSEERGQPSAEIRPYAAACSGYKPDFSTTTPPLPVPDD